MGLIQYDSPNSSADVAGEVKAAKQNLIEIAQFYSNIVEPGGVKMPQPVWYLEDFLPFIESTMVTTGNYGNVYDYKPDFLSKFLYDTHDLMYMLMQLNGAPTRDAFVGPTFTIVAPAAISQMLPALLLAQSRAQAASATVPAYGDLTIEPLPTYLGF